MYELGTAVILTASFTDNATPANPLDPTVVTLIIEPPRGAVRTYTYPSGTAITRSVLGTFTYLLSLDQTTQWSYKWEGIGAVTAAAEKTIYVTGNIHSAQGSVGTEGSGGATAPPGPQVMATYTTTTRPAASSYAGGVIYVSNAPRRLQYSDGTNWITTQDKVAVTDYGATGDGATNDTTAITAAIAAAGIGGKVYFPAGQYRVSQLRPLLGQVWEGQSPGGFGIVPAASSVSTITRLAGTNIDLILGDVGVAHVHLRDLHLDGNKNNNTTGDGVHLTDASGEEAQWKISNCYIESNPGHGVYLGSGRRATKVDLCTVLQNGVTGVRINASDCEVRSSLIGSNISDGIGVGNSVTRIIGNDIWGNSSGVTVYSGGISQVMLFANGIDRNLRHGVYLNTGAQDIAITGNDFHSNSQESNGAYHHITVVTETGRVAVHGNVWGVDSGITNAAGYCLYLQNPLSSVDYSGASSVPTGASVSGLTNDFRRLRTGALALATFLSAARPAAASYTGALIFVSDATAGSRLQYSDGVTWVAAG